jgi:hypothetical protein
MMTGETIEIRRSVASWSCRAAFALGVAAVGLIFCWGTVERLERGRPLRPAPLVVGLVLVAVGGYALARCLLRMLDRRPQLRLEPDELQLFFWERGSDTPAILRLSWDDLENAVQHTEGGLWGPGAAALVLTLEGGNELTFGVGSLDRSPRQIVNLVRQRIALAAQGGAAPDDAFARRQAMLSGERERAPGDTTGFRQPFPLDCPQCGLPSDRIKRVSCAHLTFLVVMYNFSSTSFVGCPACARGELGQKLMGNLLRANLFRAVLLPFYAGQWWSTRRPGHSRAVLEQLPPTFRPTPADDF